MVDPIVSYVGGKPFVVHCPVCLLGQLLDTAEATPELAVQHSRLIMEQALKISAQCCQLPNCDVCGKQCERHWSVCRACRTFNDAAQQEKLFQEAKKMTIEEYMATANGLTQMLKGAGDEEYFDPTDWEDCQVEGYMEAADGTHFVWATERRGVEVDLVQTCSENWLQEHHEDAMEQVDEKKLAEAEVLVNEALKKVITFYPDETIAVIIPPFEDEEDDDE